MSGLITAAEQKNLTGIFGDIFDTFARDIVIHKKPVKIIPSGVVIDTAFIFGYEAGTESEDYQYAYESGTYPAVIRYDHRLDTPDYGDIGVDQPVIQGSIKVKKAAEQYIEVGRSIERVTVDEKDFKIIGQGRLQSFLGSSFYIYKIQALK
jgi:hypothetical protein